MSNPPPRIPDPRPTVDASPPAAEVTPLSEVDYHFKQVACLGHGGFGSVFLAKKRSGRHVALKFMRFDIDDNDGDGPEALNREIDAALRMECSDEDYRDFAIVYFEDWFTGPNYACIVMQYADGGTLAQEILAKRDSREPYSERRIAHYALQLCDALAYAHSRGVAHHDVKSANVLIDLTGGGRLLLADFGSAVSPGGEVQNITEIYASPELQQACAQNEFSGLDHERVDSWGLGCILYECLCCKKLVDLTGEQTLAEFVRNKQSAEAALDLPCIRLRWLPPHTDQTQKLLVGYTQALKRIIQHLLEPEPTDRFKPAEMQNPLRRDPRSPLLLDYVSAARAPQPGAVVTVDNVQLGMFVQRGPDWADGHADGGIDSVGVVINLDPDAGYTEVAFPSRDAALQPKPLICRIGSSNKFEIQVGPTPMNDFHWGTSKTKNRGIVYSSDTSKYHVGQKFNENCMVVGIQQQANLILIAPMEKITITPLSFSRPQPLAHQVLSPRKPVAIPDTWEPGSEALHEVTDVGERQMVLDMFFGEDGSMDIQDYEIESIRRVQSTTRWEAFGIAREQVALENWGVVGEKRLFVGTGQPRTVLQTASDVFTRCMTSLTFSKTARFADVFSHRSADGDNGRSVRQVVLARVALGRIRNDERDEPPLLDGPRPSHALVYHSSRGTAGSQYTYTIRCPSMAFPEYLIAYRPHQRPGRRFVRARRPQQSRQGSVSGRPGRRTAFHVRPSSRQNQGAGLSSPTENTPVTSSRATSSAVARLRTATAASTPPTGQSSEGTTPASTGTTRSQTKECVVCMERPVCMILIPCGHICLCEICSSRQGLRKLKKKCPECRTEFRMANKVYGRVVED